jgi:amino acid permease
MLLTFAAFACGFLMDALWVRCIASVHNRNAIRAANASLALYACSTLATVLIVEQCFLACAAYAVGGWLGTYVGVKR